MQPDIDDAEDVTVHLAWPASQPELPQRPELRAGPARPEPSHVEPQPAEPSKAPKPPAPESLAELPPRTEVAKVTHLAREEPVASSPRDDLAALNAIEATVQELAGATGRVEELAGAAATFGPALTERITAYTANVVAVASTLTEHIEACQWRQDQMMSELRAGMPTDLKDQVISALNSGLADLAISLPPAMAERLDALMTGRLESAVGRVGMESSIAQRRVIDQLSALTDQQATVSRAQGEALSDLRETLAPQVADRLTSTIADLVTDLSMSLRTELRAELAAAIDERIGRAVDSAVAHRLDALAERVSREAATVQRVLGRQLAAISEQRTANDRPGGQAESGSESAGQLVGVLGDIRAELGRLSSRVDELHTELGTSEAAVKETPRYVAPTRTYEARGAGRG